jgi:cell wall-associated NlpC family hydrolase
VSVFYGIVSRVHLTEGSRRIARTIRQAGRRRKLSAAIAVFAALGALAGGLAAIFSAPPQDSAAIGNPIAAAQFGLGAAHPSTSGAPVISAVPLTLGAGARLLAGSSVPAVQTTARHARVAPLRRTLQPDLLIVGPASLPAGLLDTVLNLPGTVAAERIEAVRLRINGTSTAVIGADPSVFRSFAARATGASSALWQGVADGGIAVSYSMGQLGRLPLGGSVTAAGSVTRRLKVVAFGTLGIGGVDAVVSDKTAARLGAPAGNAIVVSVRADYFTADAAAIGRVLPQGAGVQQLVSLVSPGTAGAGPVPTGPASTGPVSALSTAPASTAPVSTAPASTSPASTGPVSTGPVSAGTVSVPAINTMLRAAMSRRGMPYVWGAAGPDAFDCSGLVRWAFAQAGITMPRVAADQALAGPAVPVSHLQPGDLLFYHTDPTDPGYISHVAIFIGNGWMLQAPSPGEVVEVVPADLGPQFAGAIRVNPAQAAAVASGLA